MSKIIPFSGACHSGKTQTMNYFTNKYSSYFIPFTEILRENTQIESIDGIREKPKEYFKLQKKIISEKILQEEKAINDTKKITYIFDRSLADSLYYYLIYVNKNEVDIEEYENFLTYILNKMNLHFEEYTALFLFKPIKDINENDSFRPKKIKHLQENEYNIIKMLNENYTIMKNKNLHIYDVLLDMKDIEMRILEYAKH